jgi:phosphatidylethanolamine/phosphatidyl-N-methylethanolamine N-methyltransferase
MCRTRRVEKGQEPFFNSLLGALLTPRTCANGHDTNRMSDPADTTADRAHAWTFFRQWLKNPIKMASIAPSGQQLAQMMIAELPPGAQRVIELGGGTGVFTRALLASGIAGDDLMVVELNVELHAHLQKLFPQVHVAQGDASKLERIAADNGYAARGPADAVISGLGMLSMPKSLQRDIMASAFACLRPGGHFVQFTYGPAVPIAQEVVETLRLDARKCATAWRNLPPATVYVFTQRT